jgi:hypothetical protein
MIQLVINWLVSSFINGLCFFLLFLVLFYWLYIKDLPVLKPPVYPQFEKFKLSDVCLNLILYSLFTIQNINLCKNY